MAEVASPEKAPTQVGSPSATLASLGSGAASPKSAVATEKLAFDVSQGSQGDPPKELVRAVSDASQADSTQTSAAEGQDPVNLNEKLYVIEFDPGRLGMNLHLDSGRVQQVHDPIINKETGTWEGQACKRGVKPGFIARTIDGKFYDWDVLKKKIKIASNVFPYTVGFELPSHKVPKVLFFHSPSANKECEGRWEIMPTKHPNGMFIGGSTPNGMRIWKHTEIERYLYSSDSGGWTIAGPDANSLRHGPSRLGLISTVCGHGLKVMPHEMIGDWKRVEDGEWVVDKAILFTTAPAGSWKTI